MTGTMQNISSNRWKIPKVSWQLLVVPSVLSYGTHSILLNICKTDDGKIPFNSAAVVLLIELTKILSNLKIGTTAILYRFLLGRRLALHQWAALGLLLIGGISNSLGGIQSSSDPISGDRIHVTFPGILLILLYCIVSGFSNVFMEYLLKKHRQASLHQKNTFLYTYGIILNLGAYVMLSSRESDSSKGFFHGFTGWTVLIIFTQATNGIILSVIMKHASNIVRLFIISCAMLVNSVMSVIIFSLQLNSYFCLAFVSVITALWLYHKR